MSAAAPLPVVEVRSLSLRMSRDRSAQEVLHEVGLRIGAGEIVGLVGESGSGKSVTALSLLRLLPAGVARYGEGARISVLGRDILAMGEAELRRMRGADVSVIFQEPMTALNPVVRIERQLCEVIRRHRGGSLQAARALSLSLLADMRIADPERAMASFPHELSGGMRQRVMIAMAFSCDPALIIADEATTALDVTVQAQVLELLRQRARAKGTSVLLITHDFGVVNETCDRVYVMYRGEVVEEGSASDIIREPKHPYTRALLSALPGRGLPRARLETVAAAMHEGLEPVVRAAPLPPRVLDATRPPILETRGLTVRYPKPAALWGRATAPLPAVDGVSLVVRPGETLALVGESGCGKSSLLNALVGLVPHEGDVLYEGAPLRMPRSGVQMVFQDPQGSLDPRWPAWRIVTEPLTVAGRKGRAERRRLAAALFDRVGLSQDAIDRRPHEFSGGQRQRIAVARALSVQPRLLLLDEPPSALDVSVQAQILNLLMDLQDAAGLAYLFVSHDLAVVRHIADRIAIMQRGVIVETGDTATVLASPQHPYTRTLLAAVPRLETQDSLKPIRG